MSTASSVIDVEYPDSDGQPMGESDLHRGWMIQIINRLQRYYAGRQVYVTGNLILYYVKGNPKRGIVPDAFVTLNAEPGDRLIYKLWEERVPNVVFEVTSSSTRRNDTDEKPDLYARLGIRELFLYDPTADYLDPPLRGFRLIAGRFEEIVPDASGALSCEELGLLLTLDERDLVIRDGRTGEVLKSDAEAAEEFRLARLREREAREAAEAAFNAAVADRRSAEVALEAAVAKRRAAEAAREAAVADRSVVEAALEAAVADRSVVEAALEAAVAERRAAEAAREAAEANRESERHTRLCERQAAEQRIRDLEVELARLRSEGRE